MIPCARRHFSLRKRAALAAFRCRIGLPMSYLRFLNVWLSRIGALDYRQAKHKTSLALDSHCLPLFRRQGISIKGNHMAKFPKGRFKLEAVQPCQSFNYSFNISGYGAPLLSIA
jgi:hypothetical protein